jgi:hypothetical protein
MASRPIRVQGDCRYREKYLDRSARKASVPLQTSLVRAFGPAIAERAVANFYEPVE